MSRLNRKRAVVPVVWRASHASSAVVPVARPAMACESVKKLGRPLMKLNMSKFSWNKIFLVS